MLERHAMDWEGCMGICERCGIDQGVYVSDAWVGEG